MSRSAASALGVRVLWVVSLASLLHAQTPPVFPEQFHVGSHTLGKTVVIDLRAY